MAEENQINVEQIAEALNNEELRGQILETISGTEAGKQYLDNYANLHFEKNVGTKVGELYGNIDKDLDSLGFKKPDGVKTYEFLKSTVADLKQKADSSNPELLSQLEKEKAELLSKIENNTEAQHFKDLYESTKSTYAEQLAEKEQLINDFNNKQRLFTIEGELNKTLAKLPLNDALPEDVKKTYIDTVYSSLLQEAKILEDGSIAFYSNGELMTNKKTMSKATAEEILNDKLKSIIAAKNDVSGGGGQGELSSKKPSNVALSAAKSKLELNKLAEQHLLSNGLLKGTNDFLKEMDSIAAQYGKDLPLR
jgi:hypothetical protein